MIHKKNIKKTMHDFDLLQWIISLYIGKKIQIQPLGPKKYIGIQSNQVLVQGFF